MFFDLWPLHGSFLAYISDWLGLDSCALKANFIRMQLRAQCLLSIPPLSFTNSPTMFAHGISVIDVSDCPNCVIKKNREGGREEWEGEIKLQTVNFTRGGQFRPRSCDLRGWVRARCGSLVSSSNFYLLCAFFRSFLLSSLDVWLLGYFQDYAHKWNQVRWIKYHI